MCFFSMIFWLWWLLFYSEETKICFNSYWHTLHPSFFLRNPKYFHRGTLLPGREPISCAFVFSEGVSSLFEGGTLAQKQSHERAVCVNFKIKVQLQKGASKGNRSSRSAHADIRDSLKQVV